MEDGKQARAERQLEREREKLRAKQAALAKAKDKQRHRREADRQQTRIAAPATAALYSSHSADIDEHKQPQGLSHSDPQAPHSELSGPEEEKTQCEWRQWTSGQADRDERLRAAEERLRLLHVERERVEAEIEEKRQWQQQQARSVEEDRQRRLAAEREEERQQASRRQRAEQDSSEAGTRDTSMSHGEGGAAIADETAAAKTAQPLSDVQREEAAARVNQAATQKRSVGEEEAEIATRTPSHSTGVTATVVAWSEALSDVVLPSWTANQLQRAVTRTAVNNHSDTRMQRSAPALAPAAVVSSSVVSANQGIVSEAGRRPLSSLSSRPSRRSAWSIPVRPGSPASVASASPLLPHITSSTNSSIAPTSEQLLHSQSPQRLARLHRRSLPALTSSPTAADSQSQRTSPFSAAGLLSQAAASEPSSRRPSLVAAISPTPPRFSRQHLINAVNFNLLPAPSSLANRLSVLALLQSTPPAAQMLLLLHASPSSALSLRALFVYRADSREAASVWEGGSVAVGRVVTEAQLDRVWKYDSGKKGFVELLGVRSFAPTSHAFTLHKRVR